MLEFIKKLNCTSYIFRTVEENVAGEILEIKDNFVLLKTEKDKLMIINLDNVTSISPYLKKVGPVSRPIGL